VADPAETREHDPLDALIELIAANPNSAVHIPAIKAVITADRERIRQQAYERAEALTIARLRKRFNEEGLHGHYNIVQEEFEHNEVAKDIRQQAYAEAIEAACETIIAWFQRHEGQGNLLDAVRALAPPAIPQERERLAGEKLTGDQIDSISLAVQKAVSDYEESLNEGDVLDWNYLESLVDTAVQDAIARELEGDRK
jgi:hypothetical protein